MQLHIDLRNLIPRKHISFRIKIKAVSKDQVNESPTVLGNYYIFETGDTETTASEFKKLQIKEEEFCIESIDGNKNIREKNGQLSPERKSMMS